MRVEEQAMALKARHEMLEAMIQQELNRPNPDHMEVSHLKKQKLQVKDRLSTVTTQ